MPPHLLLSRWAKRNRPLLVVSVLATALACPLLGGERSWMAGGLGAGDADRSGALAAQFDPNEASGPYASLPAVGLGVRVDADLRRARIPRRIETSAGDVIVFEVDRRHYRVTDGETGVTGRERPVLEDLQLRNARFDPTSDQAPLPTDRARAYPVETDLHIVQFLTHPLAAYRDEIEAFGGTVHSYLPDNAQLVHAPSASLEQIAALPYVRAHIPFEPRLKIDPALDARIGRGEATGARYAALLVDADPARMASVTEKILAAGGRVDFAQPGTGRLDATLTPDQVDLLVSLDDVEFVDAWSPDEADVDLARAVGGANEIEATSGYTGEGVSAAVVDAGLRVSHVEWSHRAPLVFSNSGITAHGTPVYGLLFAAGISSAHRGLIPDAQGIFAASSELDRHAFHAALTDPDGPYRAVLQTSSVGNGRTTEYTTISAALDQVLFDFDVLTLQSQSNAGTQDSRPQAWAKNLVSVGGFAHFNNTLPSDDSWSAGGASIGPAADGRIKPDLSFWYDAVATTDDDSDTDYRSSFGGTSAATPLTAGYFGLLFEMWADGVFEGTTGLGRDIFDARPHAATAKALAINTAFQYDFVGIDADMTRTHQGWGRVDVKRAQDLALGGKLPLIVDETDLLTPGSSNRYVFTQLPELASGACEFRATLVYSDLPGSPSAAIHRVNDLSMRVTTAGGSIYWGNNGLRGGNLSLAGGSSNTIDTVENVFLLDPPKGQIEIEIFGDAIVEDSHVETAALDADYALVVSGNCLSEDSDGDGLKDDVDPDDDNDGVVDAEDAFPFDPDESADLDGDGVGDNADAFPNDPTEVADTDGDGVGDFADADADNDGLPDALEMNAFGSLTTPLAEIPSDGGSATQVVDLSAYGVVIGSQVTLSQLVADGDLDGESETFTLVVNDGEYVSGPLTTGAQCVGSLQSTTSDLNVTVTAIDLGGGVPGVTLAMTTSVAVDPLAACNEVAVEYQLSVSIFSPDFDGDGIPNAQDLDSDNDTIPDLVESGLSDTNFDLLVDDLAFEASVNPAPDTDGDGWPDFLDLERMNPLNDGTEFDMAAGDFALLDTNGDGVLDQWDALGGVDLNRNGADDQIEIFDRDGDGIVDAEDAFPNDPNETVDSDGDGVGDNGDIFPFDPAEFADTDEDGVGDNADPFPNDSSETLDTDGDGIGDNADLDDDGDGEPDLTDAFPKDDTEQFDSDGDGLGDHADLDDDNDGLSDLTESGVPDSEGMSFGEELDSDGDGLIDSLDLDSDGDTVLDVTEAGLVDANDDGMVDDSEFLQGSVIDPPDQDEDGIPDYLDLESQNALNDGTAFDIDGGEYAYFDTNGDGRFDSADFRGGMDENWNGIEDFREVPEPGLFVGLGLGSLVLLRRRNACRRKAGRN